ncbi:ATP-binding protein [Microgenomates group bacterium]|nr:ATP-binding protein [Microgenomates group bacterium]
MTNKVQLLSLKITNFRSFYNTQLINFSDDDNDARQVTAIFGPNAGGKSNTAKALWTIKEFIEKSALANSRTLYDPFQLRVGSNQEDSAFELKFNSNNRIFIYSFAVNKEMVTSEILREKNSDTDKYKVIFSRDKDKNLSSKAGEYGFNKKLADKTRAETLLITKAREDNNEYSNILFSLMDSLYIIHGGDGNIAGLAIFLINQNQELRQQALEMLKLSDFTIRDFLIQPAPLPEEMISQLPFTEEIKNNMRASGGLLTHTVHVVRDEGRRVTGQIGFDFGSQESMGTQKFFEIIVPIIDAVNRGKTVYIDEFGAYLHPKLANSIIALYKRNKGNAKLILNTHNTYLMSRDEGTLSREDIIFVEKNLDEESIITPLTSKSVREGESFEKRYRQGIYGAVPKIRLDV